MKIGIDCRMWNETGVGRYIQNIVGIIEKQDKKNQYVLFVLKDNMGMNLPSNFELVEANIRWHSVAEQFVLPFIMLRQNLDLLHSPHFNVPILYYKKFVVTIHDLTILRVKTGRATTLPFPIYFLKRLAFKLVLLNSVYRSKKVFTVSKFVLKDICKTFKVPESKIVLTPNAVTGKFFKVSAPEVKPVLNKYNIDCPYIFYIGNAHPHKNLERLLNAFEKVNKKFPDVKLVLGGSKQFFYERLEKEWQNKPVYENIKFIGFVDDADLPAIYSGADLFVNPSLYEGFGIQLLEAFACGTRVVCSNTTSLPEIGGAAAQYFNPRNVDSMASTIISALTFKDTSKIELGFEIVKKYSWKESAQKTLDIYSMFEPVLVDSPEGWHL